MKALFILLSFALAVFLWVCSIFYTKGDASVGIGLAAFAISLCSVYCGFDIVQD